MKNKCKWIYKDGQISIRETPYGFEMADCINCHTGCGKVYVEIEIIDNEDIKYCPYCGREIEVN